jgi:hypothetical protein
MIGVATPTKDTIYRADEPRNVTRHDDGKPTQRIMKPIVPMPKEP